jgi:predicted secreted protein
MKLEVSTDGGSTYTAVPGLRAPAIPATSVETYDATDSDVTDGFRVFLQGWKEKDEASLTFNYTQAVYAQLKALPDGVLDWKLVYTDAAQSTTDPEFTFQAIMSGPSPNFPLDDTWTIDIGLKGSGDDTFTEGT